MNRETRKHTCENCDILVTFKMKYDEGLRKRNNSAALLEPRAALADAVSGTELEREGSIEPPIESRGFVCRFDPAEGNVHRLTGNDDSTLLALY